MKILKGKQLVASIRIDEVFYPVFCAVGVSINYDFEDVAITTRTSGKFRQRVSGLGDWGVNVTGLTKIDNTDGQIGWLYLFQNGVRGQSVFMRLRFTDDDGNQQDVSGNVLVLRGSIDAVAGGFCTATQYFPGTGEPDLGVITGLSPQEVFKLYLPVIEGTFEVSHTDLAGVNEILLVAREDGFYEETTGVVYGRRFKYTDLGSSGKLTFDSTIPFNGGEVVYVQFRKS